METHNRQLVGERSAVHRSLLQSPCTALEAGICLPLWLGKGVVNGVRNTMESHAGHVNPECIATDAFPNIYLDQPASHKRILAVNWKSCVIHHCSHQAGTVLQSSSAPRLTRRFNNPGAMLTLTALYFSGKNIADTKESRYNMMILL